ncbi:CoA pyrophosphatase [Novosphingobium sp.]|jgi:8-oxo-dGTP pyrophosphatase MutT (NUDIX family)|uniref:CoA pyrophosphatase n=1 Tax=Novosphingobium sp. TaxID=1874826 RepID=UPI001EBF4DD6|nr:CoA pyrophosphatase [Novosphingobium sp.]MBK6801514.1 CoA pyrophosphatase [Novosphingobium sp.]MBK9010582.1 CoA pyrophosphatase [Novosphingobium sp.]
MSLVERLRRLHAEGHAREVEGLRDDHWLSPPEMRDAAVLAAITDGPRPGFLLIHRPSNMRSHPGQVAFPGGKVDPGETPVEAALREAWEEMGIRESDVTVIGTSDVYRTGTGYSITPVLAVVPPDIEINPSPTEVAAWFEAPVDFVFDTANHSHNAATFMGKERRYIEIMWQQHRIWGVTAAIINNLSRRIDWHGDGAND